MCTQLVNMLLYTHDSYTCFLFPQGFKIHDTCKKNYLNSLENECNVGEWNTIYNLQVTNNQHKNAHINEKHFFISMGQNINNMRET